MLNEEKKIKCVALHNDGKHIATALEKEKARSAKLIESLENIVKHFHPMKDSNWPYYVCDVASSAIKEYAREQE